MNLWLIYHYTNPPNEPGDARHYSYARELMERGHTVRIVACNFEHLQRKHIPMAPGRIWEHMVFSGVPFTWIRASGYRTNFEPSRLWNMFQFAFRAWKGDWAKDLEPPDIILGSTPDPFAAWSAERLAARYGVPFLLEVCDPWPYAITEINQISRYHPFVVLIDKVMRYLYTRASRVIMLSRDSQDLLVNYGADLKKIVWIPHGVDLTMNPEPRPAPEDRLFTVTYLGAHNPWNSLDVVLDAARLLQCEGLDHIQFRFVGDGAGKVALLERARVEGLHNVRFENAVPKTDVARIKHESDAFIINNREDGVSKNWMSFNKIYDYLAAGRPVVFGSFTQNDPVKESGGGISVPAGDATAIAEAIKMLARCSPEQLAEYGARARKFIAGYTIGTLTDRFEALAKQCIQEPLPGNRPRQPDHVYDSSNDGVAQ